MLLATNRHGLAGSAAVRDADLRQDIASINRPTLVIAGEHDTVTAASHGEAMAATIAGARLLVLPAVVQCQYPDEVSAVMEFLASRAVQAE